MSEKYSNFSERQQRIIGKIKGDIEEMLGNYLCSLLHEIIDIRGKAVIKAGEKIGDITKKYNYELPKSERMCMDPIAFKKIIGEFLDKFNEKVLSSTIELKEAILKGPPSEIIKSEEVQIEL